MAAYDERMSDLSSLSDEDLSALEAEIVDAFDAADNADDLDAMAAAADALDQVRAEQASRAPSEAPAEGEAPKGEEAVAASAENVETEETTTATEEVTASVEQPEPSTEESAEEVEETEEAETEDATETEQPEDTTPDAPEASTETAPAESAPVESEAAAVAAAATTDPGQEEAPVDTGIPEDRAPVPNTASTVANTITAGADLPGVPVGSEFPDSHALSQAMVRRIDSLRGLRGGDGEKLTVATITASGVPESQQLLDRDPEGNAEKIRKATTPTAITAAGGYCAPLESRYDIFGLGVADRPIRDALAGFQASRGGIRFTAPPRLGDLANAVGVWTAANDADPTPDPATKALLVVECSPEDTAVLDAVTLRLQFGNLMARAYPELVTRNNELGLIQHARLAELTLLDKIEAESLDVTAQTVLGVARDFLTQVGRASAAYRARHRMNRTDALRVIAPAWILDAIREDLAMQAPGDDALAKADAEITTYLSARNVNVTWHLDDVQWVAEVDNTTLDTFPGSVDWYLFAEGTFLFLDGGTLDLGIVRDSELVGTNDYQMFLETFEGVAKVGIESIHVTSEVDLIGSYAGPTDASALGS